jgi:hypothetical protein
VKICTNVVGLSVAAGRNLACSVLRLEVFSISDCLVSINPLLPELLLLDWWDHAVHTPIVWGMFINVVFPFDAFGAQYRLHDTIDTFNEIQSSLLIRERAGCVVEDEEDGMRRCFATAVKCSDAIFVEEHIDEESRNA